MRDADAELGLVRASSSSSVVLPATLDDAPDVAADVIERRRCSNHLFPTKAEPSSRPERGARSCRSHTHALVRHLTDENQRLVDANREFADENRRFVEANRQFAEEFRRLVEENRRLAIENQRLLHETRNLIDENQGVAIENRRLVEENRRIVDENRRLVDENQGVAIENRRLVEESKRVLDPDAKTGDPVQRLQRFEAMQGQVAAYTRSLMVAEKAMLDAQALLMGSVASVLAPLYSGPL